MGRCSGLHFGTYGYTAGLGIAAGYQSLDHPAADFAKAAWLSGEGVLMTPRTTGTDGFFVSVLRRAV